MEVPKKIQKMKRWLCFPSDFDTWQKEIRGSQTEAVVPMDQARGKKTRKVVSTARNLVTSLLTDQIYKRTSQR